VGAAQARIAAILLLTLRGTPTHYYGDELGMEDVPIPHEHVHDNWTKSEPGLGVGRDPERTPMQWDGSVNAGFSEGHPWLPVSPTYQTLNVEALDREPRSILALYRRLFALRRSRHALKTGSMRLLDAPDNVIAYERVEGTERILIALNLGHEPREVTVVAGTLLLSTHLDREGERAAARLKLRGDEGVIIDVSE
jgi:alpha-glucosidase